jgi:N6-adenosine-specific RNA methylase IME4
MGAHRDTTYIFCLPFPVSFKIKVLFTNMPIIFEQNNCILLTHDRQQHSYQLDNGTVVDYRLSQKLFNNFKRKQKAKANNTDEEPTEIEIRTRNFLRDCRAKTFFHSTNNENEIDQQKSENIAMMNQFYKTNINEVGELHGANKLSYGRVTSLSSVQYLIPPNCEFYNKRIEQIETFLPSNEANKFDFILIDPPWQNRYIKRLKKTRHERSYLMMSDDEIMKIPLHNYLKTTSLVIIWATNSDNHMEALQHMAEQWNLKLLTVWYWIKIDKCGETFCSFDGNKKPFERIIIAAHCNDESWQAIIPKNTLIFTPSSSIHSHKPPLIGE